jgi:hypothetical protein
MTNDEMRGDAGQLITAQVDLVDGFQSALARRFVLYGGIADE